MPEHFDESDLLNCDARTVLEYGSYIARRDSAKVGSLHVLLGLIEVSDDDEIHEALPDVDRTKLREKIMLDAEIKRKLADYDLDYEYTKYKFPPVERILEIAKVQAKSQGRDIVTPVDLLIGVLDDEFYNATRWLENECNISISDLRKKLQAVQSCYLCGKSSDSPTRRVFRICAFAGSTFPLRFRTCKSCYRTISNCNLTGLFVPPLPIAIVLPLSGAAIWLGEALRLNWISQLPMLFVACAIVGLFVLRAVVGNRIRTKMAEIAIPARSQEILASCSKKDWGIRTRLIPGKKELVRPFTFD